MRVTSTGSISTNIIVDKDSGKNNKSERTKSQHKKLTVNRINFYNSEELEEAVGQLLTNFIEQRRNQDTENCD